MANFTALKTAINNAIKTNGNEEITGAILQAILDAMVETLGDSAINDLENAITTEVTNRENAVGGVADNLAAEVQARQALDYNVNNRINAEEYNRQNADAALSQTMSQGFQTLGSQMTALNAAISALNAAYQNGYLYGGIATPSSSPSNNKCFYIALQGGTYTNFGGVGVVEGINIIKNDSGWKVEHIYDQTTLLNEFYQLRQQVIQAITSFAPIVIEGDVTNAPDEEDLTSNANHLLQFKNNAYSPLEFSGLGRKYLRKNIAPLSESAPFNGFVEGVTAEETLSGTPTQIFWDRMNTRFVGIKDGVYYLDWTGSDNYVPVSTSLVYMYNGTPYQWTGSDFIVDETEVPNLVNCLTQDMINEANTIYIIRYDYTLKEDITIPANCVLEFDGGSINGAYTLSGNNTGIEAGLTKIFNTDIIIDGTWVITEAHPEWFGAITNNDDIDNSVYIQAAIDFVENIGGGVVSLEGGNYYALKNTIYMKTRTSLKGKGHCVRENENVSTLKCIFANSNSWVIDNKIKGTIDGVNGEHVALYNDISYNELAGTTTSKVSSLIRQWSYSIENINIYSSTALYGGIRLFNPLYSTIRGCRIYGTIFGMSIRSAWNFNIEDCGILACRYGMVFGYDCTHVYTKNVSVACPSYTRNLVSDYTLPIIDSNFYPPYIGTPDGNGGYSTPSDAQKKAYTCGLGYTNDAYGNHIHLAVEWCDMAIGGVRHSGVYVGTYIENVNMVLWNYARTSAPGDAITLLGGSCNVPRSTLESYYMYGIVNLGKVIVEDFGAGRCYTPASDVNLSDDVISNGKKRYVIDLKTSTHESALYYDEWGSDYTNCKKSPYKMFINYPKNIEIDKNNGVRSIGIGSGGTSTERIYFVEAIKRLDGFVSYEPNFEQYPADAPIVNNKDIKLISSSNRDLQLLGPIRLKDTKIEFLSDSANIAPRKSSSYDTYGFGLSGKCYIRINNSGFTNYFNALSKWFNIDSDCDVIFSVPSPQSLGIDYKSKINNPKANHKYTITVVDDSTGNVVGVATNLYGATTERPDLNTSNKGFQYFDETLGKPIYWTGSAWVDATGATV